MKKLLFVAIATSLALTPTGMQAQTDDIVVSSSRSIDNFVEAVSRDLDRSLNRFSRSTFNQTGTGVAQVLFECGPDGKPTNIKMYSRAGDVGVNRQALRAVANIRSLHPLPQGLTNDHLYLANVIIAKDSRQFNELSEELNERETNRIAAAKSDRKIFAFTLSKTPST